MSLHQLCQTRCPVSFQSMLWLIYKRLGSSTSTQFAYGIVVSEWLKVYHTVVIKEVSIQMLSVAKIKFALLR